MKSKLIKKIGIIILAVCLVIPVAAVVKLSAADYILEEQVYLDGYVKSIVDLIKVKKAGDGTDLDGDASNGGASDLGQMRNYFVGKTSAFYRTQGVKYEYNEANACYEITSNQSCDAGIAKANGTLTVLSSYDDGLNGKKAVKTIEEGAFQACVGVTTVVLPNNFKLTANNFPNSDAKVDVCVLGSSEPTVVTRQNDGLSGKVYYQKESGACDTWKYDETGAVVKAQYKHTYGEDGVCTNDNCKKESVDELAYELNYFTPRTANSITVEKVASYTDKNEITEMNVAKITTKGTYADFVIDLPEDVTDTLTLRMLVPSSTSTHIRFRTVGVAGAECNFSGAVQDIAPGTGLAEENRDVWLDYTLDYSNTSVVYKDRLAVLVQGQSADVENTFYIAYAVNTEKIQDKLATKLSTGYLADFSSGLYEKTVGVNKVAGRTGASATAEQVASYTDKNGVTETNVMKITTKSASGYPYVGDFVLDLPQSAATKATVRILIKESDATHIGFRNIESGSEQYSGVASDLLSTKTTDNKDMWMNVEVDYSKTDSAYMNRLAMLIQGGAAGGTHTFYVAYVVETDQVKNILAAELPEDYYVADFSSALYQKLITENAHGNSLETTWLSSFEGEEGVVKVKLTGGANAKDFLITLPKSHTGKYTLRMYISSNSNVGQIGTCTSGAGWANAFFAGGYETGKWQSIKIDDSKANFNMEKIGIMGYDSSHDTLEVYLSWIIDGYDNITSAESIWRANTTSAAKTTLKNTLGDGYLADFKGDDYASLVFGCSDIARDPKSIEASYLESYTDVNGVSGEGVLKVDVVGDTTGDFLLELPKSITQNKVKVRYAVVYGDGAKDQTDYLRFKYPENASCTGMYDTSGNIADLIGDGAWHEIELNWNSTVKNYMEFQMSTDASGETVSIYFDEVTETFP